MKTLVATLLVLCSSHFALATNATTPQLPLETFGVSYNCSNSGKVELSQWMVFGQTSLFTQTGYKSFDVSFQSQDKSPSVFVSGNTVYMHVKPLRSDWPVQTKPIGQFNIGAAACDPADDGSGYGRTFEANDLDVQLNTGVNLYISNNALIVKMDGGTYKCTATTPACESL